MSNSIMIITATAGMLISMAIHFDLGALKLGIFGSAIVHLQRFCRTWIFFQNIGLDILPWDSFMSNLYSQLEYSTVEFQALHLIVIAVFGVVD